MKKVVPIVVLITSFLILPSCNGYKKVMKADFSKSKTKVSDVFPLVYDAVQQVIKDTKTEKYELDGIDLTFNTLTELNAEAGIELYVVSGKYSGAWSNSKKVTFSFGKDKDNDKKLYKDEPKIKKLKDYLTLVLQQANAVEPKDKFSLQEFEVEVEFTVSNSATGGVDFEIAPVSVSAGLGYKKEATHTITLKLKKTTGS